MNGFEAGFATVDITPPVGTPMGGNYRSDYASRGVHMPLQAHAMVLRQADVTLAIVSADLMAVTEAMTAEIRRQVTAQTGIPGRHVMVAATHTHSGPAVLSIAGAPAIADDVRVETERRIAESVCVACGNLAPAELRVATFHQQDLPYNRRIRMKDGSTRMNWESLDSDAIDGPLGPVDPQGLVLGAWAGDRLVGILVNFTLHPAVLAGDNWAMGPDWPGYLREALAPHLGHGVPVLYTNGAEGNINHLDISDPRQGRGFKEAQRIGYVLANAVLGSLAQARTIDGPLRVSSQILHVARRAVDPETRAAALARIEARGPQAVKGQEDGMPEGFFDVELIEHAGRADQSVVLEVQTMRIGGVGLAACSGEFFVEFGLQLKAQSPLCPTAFVGLANGIVGYVPLPETLHQGGYEGMTWSYNQLEPGAGDAVVRSALGQLRALCNGTVANH